MPKQHLYHPTTDTHYANSTYTANRATPSPEFEWVEGPAPNGAKAYYTVNPTSVGHQAYALLMSLPVSSRASHHSLITAIDVALQRGDVELVAHLLGTLVPNTPDETSVLSEIQGLFNTLNS